MLFGVDDGADSLRDGEGDDEREGILNWLEDDFRLDRLTRDVM